MQTVTVRGPGWVGRIGFGMQRWLKTVLPYRGGSFGICTLPLQQVPAPDALPRHAQTSRSSTYMQAEGDAPPDRARLQAGHMRRWASSRSAAV